MEILKGIQIVDNSLYIEKEKTLILSDLHLGYDEFLNKQGVLVPRFQFKEILSKLKEILKKVSPKRIILNGDLKHEFGSISYSERDQINKLIDFLKGKEIIIIKGNHDPFLDFIVNKKNLKVVKRYDFEDISIVHGDIILEDLNKTIIIGHEHPAISFPERPDEKFKCFLLGKYKRKNLVVMPSFNPVWAGADITKERVLSPYIENIKNFEVFIVEDKVYKFGKLKNLK